VSSKFRFVSEVTGRARRVSGRTFLMLVGFIWQPFVGQHLPGCRRSARDQQRSARLGGHGRVTFGFKLAPFSRHDRVPSSGGTGCLGDRSWTLLW